MKTVYVCTTMTIPVEVEDDFPLWEEAYTESDWTKAVEQIEKASGMKVFNHKNDEVLNEPFICAVFENPDGSGEIMEF